MTGTDGLLYCPLKCKQWISMLGVWHYYIFIFSLLSLCLLIALVAGTHPRLRQKKKRKKKCLRKGWHQMLITGCLGFNGQRHWAKMNKRGDTLFPCSQGWESGIVTTRNATTSPHVHLGSAPKRSSFAAGRRNGGDGVHKFTTHRREHCLWCRDLKRRGGKIYTNICRISKKK